MRISTNTLFETGTSRLGDLQTSLARSQEQMATGRRILSPSDDPVAAARALELTQGQAVNSQYAVNRDSARHLLNLQEQALQSVTSLLQDAKTLVVSAGNGALDNQQRQFIATELRGRLDDLLGLANTHDGGGNYLFSGFSTTTQPFAKTSSGANYAGDQGQRMLQVGPFRQIPLGDSGSAVFETIRTGNGSFTTAATPGNQGTGTISTGTVTGAAPGFNYTINFIDASTYEVLDNSIVPSVQVATGPYQSGNSISFNGLRVEISGAPAAGDTFNIAPASTQPIFATLTNLISVLETPVSSGASKAALSNGLSTANQQITNAIDHVLTVRASTGARLKELDSLDVQGDDRNQQYAATLAQLQDLDYTKAITDLTKQKIILEAAQQSFVKTAGLSLFNYI